MKKFLYTLLFVFTAAIWSRNVCFAEELKFGNFTYELLPDSTAEITGYTGEDKEIVIPDKAEDAPVTSIGANAFTSNKTVEQITIPVSVVSISDHAFSECLVTHFLLPHYISVNPFAGISHYSADILVPVSTLIQNIVPLSHVSVSTHFPHCTSYPALVLYFASNLPV